MGNAYSELEAAIAGTSKDEQDFLQAIYNGQDDVVAKWVQQKPAVVNAHSKLGYNAWHIAAQAGRMKVLEILHTDGAAAVKKPLPGQPLPINQRTREEGKTPLMLACENGHSDCMQYLLAQDAQQNLADSLGNTPLHYAALKGHAKILEILLARELNDNSTDPDSRLVNVRNSVGLTPLHFAAWGNQAEAAKVLLSYGARLVGGSVGDSLSIITCNGGSTPMHLAAMKGNSLVIKTLLDAYIHICHADSNSQMGITCPDPRTCTDKYGLTPFQVALNCRKEAVACMLDPDAPLDLMPAEDPRSDPREVARRNSRQDSKRRSKEQPDEGAVSLPPPLHRGSDASSLGNQSGPVSADMAGPSSATMPAAPPPPKPTVDADGVPLEFLCPITNEVMKDPVIACDGASYERSAIEMWFELGNSEFPAGKAVIHDKSLSDNTVLKERISAWKRSQ